MSQLPISEAELHAYVDGILPESRRLEIEAFLAERPDEARRIAEYKQQNARLRALFNPILDEPMPPRLVRIKSRIDPVLRRHLQRYAAVCAIALCGGMAGWLLHDQTHPSASAIQEPDGASIAANTGLALAQRAAIAHRVYSPEVRHPVELGADQEEHLVAWLSKRLGMPLRVPKLGKLGFELIGGRLLPGANGPAAQFMYQDAAGHRLTLYMSTELATSRDTSFLFSQQGQINVLYWIDGKFGCALSARIGKAELGRIADAVYEQLEKAS